MLIQEIKEYPGTDVLADIIVDVNGKKSAAVAYKISRAGILFVTSSLFADGDRCLVYLKRNRNLFKTKGTIQWLKRIDPKDDMFRCCMEFSEPLEQINIDLFIRCCN